MPVTELPTECDVIVIGAGIAGLTATALLTKAGLRVVLLEEQARPGGYLMGFKRKGFSFDSSIQWLNGCNEGGFVNRVFDHIALDHPACKNMDIIRRYKSKAFDYVLTREPNTLRDRLIKDFPDEKEGLIRFFKDCKRLGGHFGILNKRMRAIETMSPLEKMTYGLKMLWWVLPVFRYLKVSAEKGLALYFKNEAIKKIFCSESTFMSIIMPIAWAYVKDFQSPPEGGAEAFVDWLCEVIKRSPSELFLNSRVEKILVDNGKAAGVTLSDGHTIRSQYVIAACDVEVLYEKILPVGAVPETLIRKLHDADLYYSSATVYIGLNCDASTLGLHEGLTCLTVEGIERKEHSSGDPKKNSLIVQIPSARDSSLAPKGKSTLTIHCAAWIDYENCWATDTALHRGKAYRDLKQKVADILIDRVEKAMQVNIQEHIEVLEVATPVTYWRYTKNRNGSNMGASPTQKNIKNKLAHYKTPVKNLFLGGHWAEYGGGVPIAIKAATNVSLLILKGSKIAEFVELRNVMDGTINQQALSPVDK